MRTTKITVITVVGGGVWHTGVVRGKIDLDQREKLAASPEMQGKQIYFWETILAPTLGKLPKFEDATQNDFLFTSGLVPLPDEVLIDRPIDVKPES